MGKRLAVTLFLLSCGGGQTTKPKPPEDAQKDYKPFTIKDDAKSPNQAVILGTDAKNGSTIVKLPPTGVRGTVDAMWVKLGPQVSGGSTPVKLGTSPNSDHTVQVGVFKRWPGAPATIGPRACGSRRSSLRTRSARPQGLPGLRGEQRLLQGASAFGLMAGGLLAPITGKKSIRGSR